MNDTTFIYIYNLYNNFILLLYIMVYFTDNPELGGKQIATIEDGKRRIPIYLVDNNDNSSDSSDDEIGYTRIKKKVKNNNNGIYKEIKLNKGKFIPYPGDREYYISGPSGSGKSYLAAQIIKEYKREKPKNPFYLFSRLKDDECLDKLKPLRIEIDESLYTDPIDVEELDKSIVLFDDIQTISDKKIAGAVANLRDSILEVGRHFDTKIIATTHNLVDHKNTRLLLVEASNVVIFPKCGDTFHINRFLQVYVGLKKNMMDRILSTKNSRWVLVHKKAPQYIMTEKELYLL